MTTHMERRRILRTPETVFDLVADVESYPEFLPMWKTASIRDRSKNLYVTEQDVGFGPIRQRFMTRTVLKRPEVIEVTSDDPVFRKFVIRWRFQDIGDACNVVIALDWRTRSFVLQRAIDAVLPQTARTMIQAFEKRALGR